MADEAVDNPATKLPDKGVSYHVYTTKIKCNRCERRTNKAFKIQYRNFPQHGASRARVMTMCPTCRDDLVLDITIQKLLGQQ